MKYLIIVMGLAAFNLATAQSNQIRNLEKKIPAAKGADRVEKLIRLSELLAKEGYYSDAIRIAQDAGREASFMDRPDLKAHALKSEAIAVFNKGGLFSKNKSESLLEDGLTLLKGSNNKALKLDILKKLKRYATRRGQEDKAYEYSLQIAKIKGEEAPPPPESSTGLFGNRRKVLNEMRHRQLELNNRLDSLQEIAEVSETLQAERRVLNQLIRKREQQVENLTDEQIKQQLLLSQKEKILDSLLFVKLLDSIQLQQQQSELREKELEINEAQIALELRESQRNLLIAAALIILLVAFGIWSRYANMKKHSTILEEKNKIIEEQQARSEELILNILPKTIAEELKQNGTAKARQYHQVTVIFTDFENFSQIAEALSPAELVAELDYCFKKFDEIVSRHGLEKIKTIGDSYMFAGGLPEPDPAHPKKAIRAALEIQQFLTEWNTQRRKEGKPEFEARLGVHSGPIVAGVVGEKKYAYDIWGDTVNIASRMESSGEAGKVNISADTFHLINADFDCEFRGKVPAKNIGEIEMYFVNGLKKSA